MFKKDSVSINIDAIKKAIKDSNMSQTKVLSNINLSQGILYTWKKSGKAKKSNILKLADFLGVDSSLFIKQESLNLNEEKNVSADDQSVKSSISLTPIGDTLNVHEIFKIINDNIITIGNALSEYIESQDNKNNELINMINELNVNNTAKMIAFIKSIQDKNNVNKESNHNIKNANISNDEILKLSSSYKENDSFETYKKKINKMLYYIGAHENFTHRQLLHNFYVEMTTVYGCVYDQLKKDFYCKYGRNSSNSMELIHSDEIFRQIFYNIISNKMIKYAS